MNKIDKHKKIVTYFDYDRLTPEQRALILQRTGEIRERLQRSAQDIWEIGQRLADVRAQLKHGQFENWLRVEFDWSRRTAYNFINVYETFGERANLAQIDIATSALYLLAAPSTPQDVREQYIQKAKEGEKITHKELRNNIGSKKPHPNTSNTIISSESTKNSASVPEIIKVIPKLVVDTEAVEVLEPEPARATSVITNEVHIGWHLLGRQHFIYCGDTAGAEFHQKIPDFSLAVAATSSNWNHDWLTDSAETLIVLTEEALSKDKLKQLIAMFSQPGEVIVFPWLPYPDMIKVAHEMGRKVIAGDSSPHRCYQAMEASGLGVVSGLHHKNAIKSS